MDAAFGKEKTNHKVGILKTTKSSSMLPAATLIEVVVAMLIITVVFTISLNILLKVSQSGYSLSKIKAIQDVKKVMFTTIREKKFLDEELPMEGYLIKKTIKAYPMDSLVSELSIRAENREGKLIYQQKRLVNVHEE